MTSRHWLVKSEPETYSIQDLARDGRTHWEGVRNYQARIHLRNMQVGDEVLFYHSNAEPSGAVGVCRVARAAYPDPSALDPDSPYHDPGATDADPRWVMVDVEHVATWPRVVALEELKQEPALEGMEVTRKGSRLSVSPVSAEHFARVVQMAHEEPRTAGGGAPKTKAGPQTAGTRKKAAKKAKKAKKPAARKKPAPKKAAAQKTTKKKARASTTTAKKPAPPSAQRPAAKKPSKSPAKPARARRPAPTA